VGIGLGLMLASPVMGHCGTYPLDFQQQIFQLTSDHTKSKTVDSVCLPILYRFGYAWNRQRGSSITLKNTKIVIIFGRDSTPDPPGSLRCYPWPHSQSGRWCPPHSLPNRRLKRLFQRLGSCPLPPNPGDATEG